jgi:DNA-binding transcriptional ArsR family regulator
MIDQLRRQIKQRLDELEAEAKQLRTALGALEGPAPSVASERKPSTRARSSSPSASRNGHSVTPPPSRRTRRAATRSPRRTASGSTKTAVLSALVGGEAMTASEVAAKAGLGRATVSTTLSKLAKSGEVQKATRGYQLPTATAAAAS